MELCDVAGTRSWRWYRSKLFGLPSTSRTWAWIQQQNDPASRQQNVLDSPDDVAAFLGINTTLEDE